MVSGSSVGNTVTTGSVTIPMMKDTGYKPEFAGAVEAASSTGGQIMPPIMGAAAFLMADFVGVPYSNIIVRAILPALLYFTGIFISVHLEAKKLGLSGIPKEKLPVFKLLIRKIYLLLPLVMLVIWVSGNYMTMQKAASYAIVLSVIVSLFDKENRISVTKCIDALEAGGRGVISVAVACGVAGIISGSITMTGLANDLINGIISVANGKLIIALLLTMYRTWYGCTYHCQLLYHGSNLCSDPGTYGSTYTGSSFLCILLWYCCRYHTAGSAGCLRRFSHSEGQSDEDCIYSLQAGYRSIYRTLCILL